MDQNPSDAQLVGRLLELTDLETRIAVLLLAKILRYEEIVHVIKDSTVQGLAVTISSLDTGQARSYLTLLAENSKIPSDSFDLCHCAPATLLSFILTACLLIPEDSLASFFKCLVLYSTEALDMEVALEWISQISFCVGLKFAEAVKNNDQKVFHPRLLQVALRLDLTKNLRDYFIPAAFESSMEHYSKADSDSCMDRAVKSRFSVRKTANFETQIEILEMQSSHFFKTWLEITSCVLCGRLPDISVTEKVSLALYGRVVDLQEKPWMLPRVLSHIREVGSKSHKAYEAALIRSLSDTSPDSFEWRIKRNKTLSPRFMVRTVFFCGRKIDCPSDSQLNVMSSTFLPILSSFGISEPTCIETIKRIKEKKFYMTQTGLIAVLTLLECVTDLVNVDVQVLMKMKIILKNEAPPYPSLVGTKAAHFDKLLSRLHSSFIIFQKEGSKTHISSSPDMIISNSVSILFFQGERKGTQLFFSSHVVPSSQKLL